MRRPPAKHLSVTAVGALALGILACSASCQDSSGLGGPAAIPASSNVRDSRLPGIDGERHVTFRLKAPDAHLVEVHGLGSLWGGTSFPLTRGSDGVWTGTSAPAEPGFWYYALLVDGVAVNDPGSETYFGWGRPTSGLEVPDPALGFYDIKDVPHGEVRFHTYHAATTGLPRRVVVYTPPDYDRHADQRYPVLYLQHGSGESERAWTAQGRAQYILDNLLAEKRAAEMIMVMELGYARKAGTPAAPTARGEDGFEDLVVNDLVPMIDATYRTIAKREQRAIAGLSMGAWQAIRIGLGHQDLFASVAALSGGASSPPGSAANPARPPGIAKALEDPAAFNSAMRLLWIGCGQQDGFYPRIKEAHEALATAQLAHVWFEIPGGHDWQVWRKSLYDLVPRLFRVP